DSFQEADISGMTMPVTKHNYLVTSVEKLADTIREAFYIARSGRPGPVLVDIPKDVQLAETEYIPLSGEALIPRLSKKKPLSQLRPEGEALEMYKTKAEPRLEKAAQLIAEAHRPLIYCGGGVTISGAQDELMQLADRVDAPIVATLMGLGAAPASSDRMLGMLGMHGTHAANIAMQRCDLLIAVGVRFSDRALGDAKAFAPNAKVLHIDIDRAEINKNVSTALHITGDAKTVLDLLLTRVSQKQHAQWMQQARSMMEDYLSDELFEPRKILKAMAAVAPEMTVATDVGQHQMWTAQHFPFVHARQLISSGGLGTMGFGLGAAMGAAKSDPQGRPVALVTGDGSFRMNLTELSTIAYYDIPVIVVIFNNGTLGMVRQWQTLFFGHRYSQTTLDRGPDFIKLADAYGMEGTRVDNLADFSAAFAKAYEAGRPCIIECLLDIDEMVAPMVAPGSPIDSFCLN
ncbi:MAG: thiamine pyrophosphate-dependent enzyme, partial [Candidatus Ventricola sp.]